MISSCSTVIETIAGLKFSSELYEGRLGSMAIPQALSELQTSIISTIPLQATRELMSPKVRMLLDLDPVSGPKLTFILPFVTEAHPSRGNTTSARIGTPWIPGANPVTSNPRNVSDHGAAVPIRRRTSNQESKSQGLQSPIRSRKLTKYFRTFLEFDRGQSSTSRGRNSVHCTITANAATPKNPSFSSCFSPFQELR